MPESTRPIFLVGCPRSGTTLLSVLLHAHPRIAMPPETRFLIPAYDHRERFGDLTYAENRRALGESITGRGSRFRDLRLDRKAVVQAIVDAPPTFGSACATVWREFARDRGKQRWGEKRPAYWRDMGVIMRLFPTAQVIHLVRDPRSCVASLKQVSWWRRSVPYSAVLWNMANAELTRLGRRLPADSYHRIRYENLVSDPRGELQALCRFLDEDFSESMLEHAGAAKDIVPSPKVWHSRVHHEVDPARVDAWRSVLAPEEAGLVNLVARRGMRQNGYRSGDVHARPLPADLAEFAWITSTRRVRLTERRLSDARLRRRLPMPLAAEL